MGLAGDDRHQNGSRLQFCGLGLGAGDGQVLDKHDDFARSEPHLKPGALRLLQPMADDAHRFQIGVFGFLLDDVETRHAGVQIEVSHPLFAVRLPTARRGGRGLERE